MSFFLWKKEEGKAPPDSTVPSGFPDATTTGPQSGTVFTNTSGELRTTANGQVIQGLRHDGYILMMHNNVTIQDCIITGSTIFPISTNSIPSTGCIIRRCRISGSFGLSAIDTFRADNLEIANCDLSGVENGVTFSSSFVNIHDNYIHDLSRGNPTADESAHFDGIQGDAGTNCTNITINHNTIQSRDTSGIIAGNHTQSTQTLYSITNNLFLHNFPISYGAHLDGVNQLTFSDNRISIDNFGGGPGIQRPIFPIDLASCPTPIVSNNVHHESGALLVPSIS